MSGSINGTSMASPGRDAGDGLASVLERFHRTAELLLQRLQQQSPGPGVDDGTLAVPPHEQLRELRAAMPRRRLQLGEAKRIAERQAALLRWQLSQAATPALPTETLMGLPFLTVMFRDGLAKSALATKTERGWVIVLRADEPDVRQRFSLAHEIKHVLDDELMRTHDRGLYLPSIRHSSEEQTERVCDHFAACLLMPKMLLRRDWTSLIQETARLARRYHVSQAAIEIRLRELGLIEPTPRCGTRHLGAALDSAAIQSDDVRS